MDCKYVELLSVWIDVDAVIAQKITKPFQNDENFTSLMYDAPNKTVSIYHYIIVGNDGITLQNLIENLEYFDRENDTISKRLQG